MKEYCQKYYKTLRKCKGHQKNIRVLAWQGQHCYVTCFKLKYQKWVYHQISLKYGGKARKVWQTSIHQQIAGTFTRRAKIDIFKKVNKQHWNISAISPAIMTHMQDILTHNLGFLQSAETIFTVTVPKMIHECYETSRKTRKTKNTCKILKNAGNLNCEQGRGQASGNSTKSSHKHSSMRIWSRKCKNNPKNVKIRYPHLRHLLKVICWNNPNFCRILIKNVLKSLITTISLI